jgi:hypothetical protein
MGAITCTDSSDMFMTPDRRTGDPSPWPRPADTAKLSIPHRAAEILDNQVSLRAPCPPDLFRRL